MTNLLPSSWFRHVPALKSQGSDPFLSLHQQVERLFDDFAQNFHLTPERFGPGVAVPQMDVSETDDNIKIEADLPGVDEKDVTIEMSDNVLTIRGQRKDEHEEKHKDYRVVERASGSFSRSLTLPYEVDPDAIKAQFSKGVLAVTIPKSPQVQAKSHKIAIESK